MTTAETRVAIFTVARLSPKNAQMGAAIDSFAASVRAETLAPATEGQSPELARAERVLRDDSTEVSREDAVVLLAEFTRLRASLAAVEAENVAVRGDNASLLAERDGMESMITQLGRENAELRELCGKAAEQLLHTPLRQELEAARRRPANDSTKGRDR